MQTLLHIVGLPAVANLQSLSLDIADSLILLFKTYEEYLLKVLLAPWVIYTLCSFSSSFSSSSQLQLSDLLVTKLSSAHL